MEVINKSTIHDQSTNTDFVHYLFDDVGFGYDLLANPSEEDMKHYRAMYAALKEKQARGWSMSGQERAALAAFTDYFGDKTV